MSGGVVAGGALGHPDDRGRFVERWRYDDALLSCCGQGSFSLSHPGASKDPPFFPRDNEPTVLQEVFPGSWTQTRPQAVYMGAGKPGPAPVPTQAALATGRSAASRSLARMSPPGRMLPRTRMRMASVSPLAKPSASTWTSRTR